MSEEWLSRLNYIFGLEVTFPREAEQDTQVVCMCGHRKQDTYLSNKPQEAVFCADFRTGKGSC